jgi:hypothetical protein
MDQIGQHAYFPVNNGTPAGQHVYIAGDNGTNPVLWIDGSPQVLSTSIGSADQVVISGTDIYVAGLADETHPGSIGGPGGDYVYWKNGRQTDIEAVPENFGQTSVAVSGGNVYYADRLMWRNGSAWAQQGQGMYESAVFAVFGVGDDIYSVGADSTGTPVYWKNGQRVVVTQSNPMLSYPEVFSIFVADSDVYVGGFDDAGRPAYWKNGVVNELQPSNQGFNVSTAESIFVIGNDVYVVGNYYSTTLPLQPAYWKNGVQQDLPLNGATWGVANDIFVTDSTVYVAGQTSVGAALWKNGVETILATGGTANSVVFH